MSEKNAQTLSTRGSYDPHWAMISLSLAAQLWNYDRNSIHYWIERGRVYARKDAGVWLVSTDDLLSVFGMPTKPNSPNLELTWHHVKRRM